MLPQVSTAADSLENFSVAPDARLAAYPAFCSPTSVLPGTARPSRFPARGKQKIVRREACDKHNIVIACLKVTRPKNRGGVVLWGRGKRGEELCRHIILPDNAAYIMRLYRQRVSSFWWWWCL